MKKSIDSHQLADTQYEEYLESIVDTIRESLLVLDKDLRVISANRTFYEQFKVNPTSTEKVLLYELGNGQWDIPELRKLIEVILPTHNPFNGFRVEHKFPHIGKKVMLLNARQIKAKGKWKDRVLLAIEDITQFDSDRKEKEASVKREQIISDELRESELRFKVLADSSPVLMWVNGLEGCEFVNKAYLDFLGVNPPDVKKYDWARYIHPDDKDNYLKEYLQSFNSRTLFDTQFRFKRADGEYRWMRSIGSPRYDSKNNFLGFVGSTIDITDMLTVSKQKDEFIGIASHELKTPVTSIKAYGQVLQKVFQKKGDTKAVEALQKMDAQINKLTNLIGDLLDVTKIQSGRLEFHEEYFDFDDLVNEVVDEMQLTSEKHVLIKELSSSIRVLGDKERIGQVLTNLISNGIKYSPHTEKIIINTDSNKDSVRLCVKDFGVGIPQEKKQKVFQQFFRVSGPNHSTVPGLGLGLYISSQIIKRQGGEIWVESEEGKGSTFCFSMPIKKRKSKSKNRLAEVDIQHE